MTLTEALARDMFSHEHEDAAPGATDEAWADDADLRAFWTTRSTRAIAFMAEWRVRARNAAAPPDDGGDMCPNCITPWKCNGPHLSP